MKPAVLSTLLLVLVATADGVAQIARRDPAREQRIVNLLSVGAPASVPEFVRATADLDAGHCELAVPLFRDVLRSAPAFTPALRRLGYCLMGTGFPMEGLSVLERAVSLERSPENLFSLAQALPFTADGKPPSQLALDRAWSLAQEAVALEPSSNDPNGLHLLAQLALARGRIDTFREMVAALQARFPDTIAAHYDAAVLAAISNRWAETAREFDAAERLGLPHEARIAFLERHGRYRSSAEWAGLAALAVLGSWLAGFLMLFLVGRTLSAATLRSLERADPNVQANSAELTIRRLYRRLIQVAGIYYYVSLPFVAALVVGGFAAVVYGCFQVGRMPIMAVFSLGVAAVGTVYRMVQSLFVTPIDREPGRRLEIAEAPALWALAGEVADAVGTRAVDEIRVTPGTEMAVYERGTSRDRREDRATRILILGVGVLNDFREPAFRAVLAHEYGHFSHRDTAGGDVALRVRHNMTTFAISIVEHGQARWWNLAFQFLRLYSRLYHRITSGATRLQEVLADRVAARIYGPAQFEDGLRHVVSRDIEFKTMADLEIRRSLAQRRPIANLYTLVGLDDPDVKGRVGDALERETTADDTHPSPADRFRLVRGVTSSSQPTANRLVWDLFVQRDALTAEMTSVVSRQVQALSN